MSRTLSGLSRRAFRVVLVASAAARASSGWAEDQAPGPAPTAIEEGLLRPGGAGARVSGAVVGTPASPRPPASEDPGRPIPPKAQPTTATPAEIVWEQPTPLAPDLSPRWVPIVPSDRSRGSADAGALKGVRVLSLANGVAQLQLAGEPAPRSLRVGDRIGSDTVLRIEAGRVVLTRPAGPGEKGDATVVVKAGPSGLGWVRVYTLKDPGPSPTVGANEAR